MVIALVHYLNHFDKNELQSILSFSFSQRDVFVDLLDKQINKKFSKLLEPHSTLHLLLYVFFTMNFSDLRSCYNKTPDEIKCLFKKLFEVISLEYIKETYNPSDFSEELNTRTISGVKNSLSFRQRIQSLCKELNPLFNTKLFSYEFVGTPREKKKMTFMNVAKLGEGGGSTKNKKDLLHGPSSLSKNVPSKNSLQKAKKRVVSIPNPSPKAKKRVVSILNPSQEKHQEAVIEHPPQTRSSEGSTKYKKISNRKSSKPPKKNITTNDIFPLLDLLIKQYQEDKSIPSSKVLKKKLNLKSSSITRRINGLIELGYISKSTNNFNSIKILKYKNGNDFSDSLSSLGEQLSDDSSSKKRTLNHVLPTQNKKRKVKFNNKVLNPQSVVQVDLTSETQAEELLEKHRELNLKFNQLNEYSQQMFDQLKKLLKQASDLMREEF